MYFFHYLFHSPDTYIWFANNSSFINSYRVGIAWKAKYACDKHILAHISKNDSILPAKCYCYSPYLSYGRIIGMYAGSFFSTNSLRTFGRLNLSATLQMASINSVKFMLRCRSLFISSTWVIIDTFQSGYT